MKTLTIVSKFSLAFGRGSRVERIDANAYNPLMKIVSTHPLIEFAFCKASSNSSFGIFSASKSCSRDGHGPCDP